MKAHARELSGDVLLERGNFDLPFFFLVLILLAFGCVMVFSASYVTSYTAEGDSYKAIRSQLFYAAFGIVVMLLLSLCNINFLRRATRIIFPFMLIFLLAVLVVGRSSHGARRWISIGPLDFQPSEFAKMALVLVLADYYARYERKARSVRYLTSALYGTVIPGAIVMVICALVLLEKHLSGTIILFAIGVLLIFCAGGKKLLLLLSGGVFAGVVALAYKLLPYVQNRVASWQHPERDPQGDGMQILQGLNAVGSGGMMGVGLGQSRQKHGFLAEADNDYIFAIICEELGFVGALAVIALFVALVARGVKIARGAPDTFSRLAVIGIVGQVGIQTILNIAVVTSLIPSTGISLPFISNGGSSLIALAFEMGVVLSISRYKRLEEPGTERAAKKSRRARRAAAATEG